MKKYKVHFFLFLNIFLYAHLCFANDFNSSVWSGLGGRAHGDNGTLIIGVNKSTNKLTGYYETSNTTEDGTNECQIFFSGTIDQKNNLTDLIMSDAHKGFLGLKSEIFKGKLVLQKNGGVFRAVLYPQEKSWSCAWLYDGLPSYMPPKDFNLRDGLKFEFIRNENHIATNVVRANRAYFHSESNDSTASKAFLVAGDLIYVYDEKPGWYYVKYQGRKKETVGWIKKSDTIQFP